MRTLLLITDLELGGTPTVVRELAIRLRRAGAEIEVACLSNWGLVASQLRDAGVPVTAFDAKGSTDFSVLSRCIRFLRERRFQTVFSFLMHANVIAAAASLRVPGVRWIQSIQTAQPGPAWHWMFQRIAQRAADVVVVPSASVAHVAAVWARVPTEKITVIPNAIDMADWVAARSSIPAENLRPYPITFLGRLDPIKDIPILVAAAAALAPMVHLHVYGEGRDRQRIEDLATHLGAPVTLHGAVTSPLLAMSGSGLLVLPSLAEGFGLVLIEAMAAGVPVVATDVAGIRDVIRSGETGLLVPAKDAIALAAAIRRIVEDRSLRTQLIQNASLDVANRFTWETVLPRYQALLQTNESNPDLPRD